jgi:PAS domain S-box-containing protein
MNDTNKPAVQERVLVLAPTTADAALCQTALTEAGCPFFLSSDLGELCRDLGEGAGAILITEALPTDGRDSLADALRRQPAWSDLPVLLLASDPADPLVSWAIEQLGNVTIVERPLRISTLVSALRVAVKARRRQYQLRDQMDALARKQEHTEASQTASEGRLRAIVEQAIAGMYVLQEDRFVYVNPRMEEIFGCSSAELTSRPVFDWIAPEDRDLARENIRKRLEEGVASIRYHLRMCRRDGQVIHTEVHGSQAEYNGKPAIIGVLLEVSQAQELEQRIQERTAQLGAANAALHADRALIEAIHQAQTRFIRAEYALEIFDGLLSSLIELTGSEYGFIHELGRTPEGQPYLTARAITEVAWNEETRPHYFKFLAGELRFSNPKSLFGAVMATGKAVIANDAQNDPRRGGIPAGHPALKAFLGLPLHSGETLVGVIGLANAPGGYREQTIEYLDPMLRACANIIVAWRNDERRRQAEEDLRVANALLDQRTVELEAVNKELEAFSWSVSHDLRAPLRAIDGFSRILLEDEATHLSEQASDCLREVRESAQQMGQLIDDLLKFSRLGRQPINTRLVATDKLVSECLEDLLPERAARQVEFVIGELPACQGDPALLKQVWMNLLSNALKYTRKKDVAVIEVGCREEDQDAVTWFVRDNGAGFDMRYVHKLFGVFQRLHRAEEYEGTGVGLAIVQRIVHRHGGRVWAEGQLDKGATFFFTLQKAS